MVAVSTCQFVTHLQAEFLFEECILFRFSCSPKFEVYTIPTCWHGARPNWWDDRFSTKALENAWTTLASGCLGQQQRHQCVSHGRGSKYSYNLHTLFRYSFCCGAIKNYLVVSNILYFHPPFGEDSQFDEHIFQVGWFNHQPENYFEKRSIFDHLLTHLFLVQVPKAEAGRRRYKS